MDHAGRKNAVLATDAGMKKPDDNVGIFLAPAAVVGIESVDAIEIGHAKWRDCTSVHLAMHS